MKNKLFLGILGIAVLMAVLILSGMSSASAEEITGPHDTVPLAPAATLVVTSTADSGAGTLRWALETAVASDSITFDTTVFPTTSPATITLNSVLPSITQGNLAIDGSDAGVILDGNNIPWGYYRAFSIESDGNIIRGLQILNFPYDGILIMNANGNVIGGDRGLGSGPLGQGNLISSNGRNGIQICGDSANNQVLGNYIGTHLTGGSAMPNDSSGIALQCSPGPHHNIIGGSTTSTRNLISGNGGGGIILRDGAHHNAVAGNYLGVNTGGTQALANYGQGIALFSGASYNIIGGDSTSERNVISGNHSEGILLYGTDVLSNTISGNYIGTNAAGTAAIGNDGGGIDVHTAAYTIIGGDNASPGGPCTGECNLVSGNTGDQGIAIFDDGAVHNTVSGNYVGTDVNGTAAIGNHSNGILIRTNAQYNIIGGDTPAERNLISGNNSSGISIDDSGAMSNTVSGNYIGTDASGQSALPNQWRGIEISNGATHNLIGGHNTSVNGACSGECNLISGNGETGVYLWGSDTANNVVSGNYIGTDASGHAALPNRWRGIGISNGATHNLIGGRNASPGRECSGECNLISGNDGAGVYLWDSDTANNVVIGNYIGTNVSGTTALANAWYGVLLHGGPQYNVIGGRTAPERNIISGHDWDGVRIHDADHNTVIGNYIGTNSAGDGALSGGQRGVFIWQSDDNVIGGSNPGEGNLISGNGSNGIWIWAWRGIQSYPDLSGQTPDYTGVFSSINFPNSGGAFAHFDGTTPTDGQGSSFYDFFAARFTGQISITVAGTYEFWLGSDDGSLLIIDGNTLIDRNYNTGFGTSYGSSYLSPGNYTIEVDYFESDGDAGLTLTSSGPGEIVFTTDGSTPGILAELFHVEPQVIPSRRNIVIGNLIGTDASGKRPLGNMYEGITLEDAESNIIGGPTDAERNIISYNGGTGVAVRGSLALSNTIQNNYIGIDADSTGGLDPRDLVVADDGTLFLADFGRGILTSTDRATSWQAASNGLTTSEIEVVAVAPQFTTTQHVWAWGDDQLFASNDAGASWTQISSALSATLKALEMSPNYASDQTLLAAVAERGIYKSTDGGVNWTRVHDTYYADNVAFSPNFASDQVVLAGLSWGGVLRSTNSGDTWVASNTGLPSLGVRDLAFTSDSLTVLLVSDNCSNDGVYRSTDGGQTWSSSGSGLEDCGSEWQIALSPDFLTDGIAFVAEDQIYRSTDGGSTWARSNDGAFGSRAHALAFSPYFSVDQTAYFANFTGVFRTMNGGDEWMWAGANLADRGNGGRGVEICCGAGATEVISNVIARNAWQGISIWDPDAAGSLVDGNLVGLGPDGVTRAGNGGTNIRIDTPYVTATNNTCAAGGHGGLRSGTNAHHLTIVGNRIGTDVSGMVAVGNSYDGFSLESSWDTVRDNLVSGNWVTGIWVSEQVSHTVFAGNLVGVDATGSHALPNDDYGIYLNGGSYNVIGGATPEDRNIISGNDSYGLALRYNAHHNAVNGNYIGTNITGTAAIGNKWYGLAIYDGATDNVIGGDTADERNVISGNDGDGIIIWGVADNTVSGNYIGADASGLAAIGNTRHGIRIGNGASQNVIGGSNAGPENACSGECNLIGGNAEHGIYIHGTGTSTNTISGNYVGANVSDTAVISNAAGGIYIGQGASGNLIGGGSAWPGGVCAGECNLIRGNGGAGVEVTDNDSLHNTIIFNSIYENAHLGIDLDDGGNTELPAPIIYPFFDIAAGTASGSACPNCTVDLFSDAHGEGRRYEASTVADINGEWHIDKGSAFVGPELTATATDAAGNTSEFGQDWPANPPPPPVFAAPVCGVTNQPQLTFAGTAQMGSTVRLGTAGLSLGETSTDDWNRWRLTTGVVLSDATHLITATATTVWGTSDEADLTMTVDSALCYNPVGVTFVQRGSAQHPHDTAGCVDPAHDLAVVLWPSEPVTVRVPVRVPTATAYVEVNSIRYDLTDPDGDGVFTGQFTAPDSGSFVILLVVDGGAGQRIMQIGSTIDPDGYVYDAKLTGCTGITQTMAGVTVTLYVSDTVRHRWVLWDAALYDQVNPQVTGADGYFSFFTPPGTYRLIAETEWYYPFTSPDLVVVDEPVRYNIPLVKIPAPDSLEKHVTPPGLVDYGDEITYTLVVSADLGAEVGIYDLLTDTTFLRFVERPSGITHADGVITGGFTVTPTHHMTVSFVTRVDAPGTLGWTFTVTNRACVYPAWRTRDDCIWTEVTNTAFHPYNVEVQKSAMPLSGQVEYGDEITYTIDLAASPGAQLALYDPLLGTTLTRFLVQPGAIAYEDGALTGTVEITSTDQATVSFVARVDVPTTPGSTATVTNSARACPVGGTHDDCVWSEDVMHTAYHPYNVEVQKSATPPSGQVEYGDAITYTINLSAAPGTQLALYDPLQEMTLIHFVEQPGSITYEDDRVTGTIEITSPGYVTVSFVARVDAPTAPGSTISVTNSARACPVGGTPDDCVWSEDVTHTAFRPYDVYMPVVMRNH